MERSFSILNHIRGNRRKNLLPETLDALMNIRNNGPRNINKFDSMACAKYWHDVEGNKLTDDTSRREFYSSKMDPDDKKGHVYFLESKLF